MHSIWRPAQILVLIVVIAGAHSNAFGQIWNGAAPNRLVTSTTSIPITFTEGPLADGTGGVFFSDMHPSTQPTTNPSRIIRYDIASGTASVPVTNSGGTNGTYRNASGNIVAAERENRRIGLRTETAGVLSTTSTSIVSTYNGSPFNGPNDVTVDSSGGIYFTDPDYEGRHSQNDSFYYYSTANVLTLLGSFGTTGRPNGIVLSPDGNTLYLALEQQAKIMAYDVTSPGVLANARVLVNTGTGNGPDGLTIDAVGNIYGAMNRAITAWNPAGTQLFTFPMPSTFGTEDPTNVEFGGPDGKTLFITAGKSLYGIHLNVASNKPGDFNQDGLLTAADIALAETALTDATNFRSAHGLTDPTLFAKVSDINGDGSFNNADMQSLLDKLIAGGGGTNPVPEPASLALLGLACATALLSRKASAIYRRQRSG